MLLIELMTEVKFSFISLALMVPPLTKVCGTTADELGAAREGAAMAIQRAAAVNLDLTIFVYSQDVEPNVAVSKDAGLGESPLFESQPDNIRAPKIASHNNRLQATRGHALRWQGGFLKFFSASVLLAIGTTMISFFMTPLAAGQDKTVCVICGDDCRGKETGGEIYYRTICNGATVADYPGHRFQPQGCRPRTRCVRPFRKLRRNWSPQAR